MPPPPYAVFEIANEALREVYVTATPRPAVEAIAAHKRSLPRALRHWCRAHGLTFRSLEFGLAKAKAAAFLRRYAARFHRPGWRVVLDAPPAPRAAVVRRLNAILRRLLALEKAERGDIQVFDPRSKTLTIVAHHGLSLKFVTGLRVVKIFGATVCGRAAGSRRTVIVPDVLECPTFAPHRAIARREGFRSVKSVPVFGPDGRLVGVASSLAGEPGKAWDETAIAPYLPELGALLSACAAPRPKGRGAPPARARAGA